MGFAVGILRSFLRASGQVLPEGLNANEASATGVTRTANDDSFNGAVLHPVVNCAFGYAEKVRLGWADKFLSASNGGHVDSQVIHHTMHHLSQNGQATILHTLGVCATHPVMAKPQSKTTVSVLRSIIGISAKELAELTGRSIHTIKSLESGRLALSEELALKMSIETGVCAQWLVNGDPQAKPIPNDLNPIPPDHPSGIFTKKYFEERREDRMLNRDELNRLGGSPVSYRRSCAQFKRQQ